MEFGRIWILRGPNIWASFPMLEVGVALGHLDRPIAQIPGLLDRLQERMPSLDFAQVDPDANLAQVLERATLALQTFAGSDVRYGVTRPQHSPGAYKVAVEYQDEDLVRECLDTARRFCMAAAEIQPFDSATEMARLREIGASQRNNPVTPAVIKAARDGGIPVQRIAGDLLQLGQGIHQQRVRLSETGRTGAVAESIAYDKELTRTLLQSVGVPVAYGRVTTDAEDAWAAAEECGLPVIVKPQYGSHDKGVAGNLTTKEAVTSAYHEAQQESSYILVEHFVAGEFFRLLIVGQQIVTGVRCGAGSWSDVTALVHPEVAARAIEAAQVVRLDIASVGVVVGDISRPLEDQGGIVFGVQAAPQLQRFADATGDGGRRIGQAIVAARFPEGHTGRIPVVAITGTNGKTTTTRLLAHVLQHAGRFVGMTCTDGIYLNGRRTETRDCSGPHSARMVLMNPQVEAAVLETARGGILREGLGFERCDIAIVTNIGEGDHLGLRGIETLEELAEVKRTVVKAVDPDGAAVLKADDPLVAEMARHCPGAVVFFARDAENATIREHRKQGGRAVFVRNGNVILAEGSNEETLAPLANVAIAHGGRAAFQVENALAAAAAAWVLKLPADQIREGLKTFSGDVDQAPGRFNVIEAQGATVIVDYAHNPSAVAALADAVQQFSSARRTIVFSACNRRDSDLIRQGEILGDAFDRVILYADYGHADRIDGELNALLRRGMEGGRRVQQVDETPGELAAIKMAMTELKRGDLLVVGTESIEEALRFVRQRLASAGR